jgi:hypothetical protein
MLTTYQKQAKRKLIATVVTLLVIAGVIVMINHLKDDDSTVAAHTTPSTPAAQSASGSTGASTTSPQPLANPTGSTSTSKNGTYTATSNYYVPDGSESIKVSLKVSNGVVTDASVQNSESDPTSARYQEDFAAAYKSAVVGQKISGLQLDVISGASDTTQGFNDALSQIEAQA